MTHDTQRLKEALEALDAHDRETRYLHERAGCSGECPPVGTFPAREERRRLLSIKVEEAARALLAEAFGVEVVP